MRMQASSLVLAAAPVGSSRVWLSGSSLGFYGPRPQGDATFAMDKSGNGRDTCELPPTAIAKARLAVTLTR